MKSELLTIKNLVINQIRNKTGLRFNLENTAQHFKGDNFLRFTGKSQGVEFCLSLDLLHSRKIEASFLVGDYRKDNYQNFSKRINFSGAKSEKAILKDLMERLEIGAINEKIAMIAEKRKEKEAKKEVEKAKTALFQRVLPNLKKYAGSYEAFFIGAKKERITFTLSEFKTDLEIRTNNADLILRICVAAAQIIEEENAKAVIA